MNVVRRPIALLLAGWATIAAAQEKKPEPPKVLLANPLGVPLGGTTKITLRGLKLDGATEVRLVDSACSAKLLSSGKSTPPSQQEAKYAGDSQVELELTSPPDLVAGEFQLIVVTPNGESEPRAIYLGGEFPVVAEKEDNDGFRRAQQIAVPQIVEATIHASQNVDVYCVTPTTDGKLSAEVFAARRGSVLDALLTVYDGRGLILTQLDDLPGTRDSRVEWQAFAGQAYLVVVQDANDQGGPAHPYRLVVRPQ